MSQLVLVSDTLITTPAAGNLEYNGQFFGTDSNASRAQLQRITVATAVTCAGQTSIEFTNIPAWVKRITVLIQGVSTSGTSNIQVQIGSTTFTTSGYSCFVASIDGTNSTSVSAPATGFLAKVGVALANTYTGTMVLNLITGNTWLSTGSTSSNAGPTTFSNGFLALGGTLDRVRLTTTGADTFDTTPSAGTVNIIYEG